MAEAEFDLKELCSKASVTPRTVHFYVQRGLLPPAGAPGAGAHYTAGHVARLRLIRLLKKQHLPLVEIGKRLKNLTDRQVEGLLTEAKQRPAASGGSALEYIRGVLSDTPPHAPAGMPRMLSAPATQPRQASMSFITAQPSHVPGRSQWERFMLADGIELHVQRPMLREQQRRLDTLISMAHDIFKEEQI